MMSEQKSMYVKEYNLGTGLLVAACDKDLVGKRFEEDGLSLKITEQFYKGKETTEADLIAALQRATIANLVGKRTIQCALDNAIIDEACVIVIEGVPHAQLLKI